MILNCLFAQRVESYEGEYAPELIASIDEIGNMENPSYLVEEVDKVRKDSDFAFYKVIEIEIDDTEFDKMFYQNYSLKGKIK